MVDTPPDYVQAEFDKHFGDVASDIDFKGEIGDGEALDDAMKRALEALDQSNIDIVNKMVNFISKSMIPNSFRAVKSYMLIKVQCPDLSEEEYREISKPLLQTLENSRCILDVTFDKIFTLMETDMGIDTATEEVN